MSGQCYISEWNENKSLIAASRILDRVVKSHNELSIKELNQITIGLVKNMIA